MDSGFIVCPVEKSGETKIVGVGLHQNQIEVPISQPQPQTQTHEDEDEDDDEQQQQIDETMIIHGIPQIPIDFFISFKQRKKRIRFTDAFGNLVYFADYFNANGNGYRVLFHPVGHPLISILRSLDGSWKCIKGDGSGEELLFRVDQTLNTLNKMEFKILLFREHGENLAFAMRGCLFWRSCTIYQDESIVAQTNLMHKLGFRKFFVRRSIFRVTVFPGFSDYDFIAALVVIFLDGRKG